MMKMHTISAWLLASVALASSAFGAEAEPVNSERRTADGDAETNTSAAQAAGPAVDTSAVGPMSDGERATSEPSSPSAVRRSPSAARSATDRLELDTTVVTGNRELPKVLYIVPWKKAEIGELPAQPFNTLLDEVLTPVDRDVFRREVTYFEAVTEGADATQSTSQPRN